MWLRMGVERLGIRRLVAEAAGAIDRTDQHLQNVQRTSSLKAVGMGGDAPHGVHGNRTADHALVTLAFHVRPRLLDGDFFLEGHAGNLGSEATNFSGGNTCLGGDGFRRICGRGILLGHHQQHRFGNATIRQFHGIRNVGARLAGVGDSLLAVPNAFYACVVAHKQAVVCRAGRVDHQPTGVGIAQQVVHIDLACAEQFVDEREDEQAICAGLHAEPVIGHGAVAGANWVH